MVSKPPTQTEVALNNISSEELREILQQLQLFSVIAECLREDQWHIQRLSVSVLTQLVSSSEWAAISFLITC